MSAQERKPGPKTMRFLEKRMRLEAEQGEWVFYRAGKWEIGLLEYSTVHVCTLEHDDGISLDTTAPTAEAAISECEQQALALFKQLGDLCGYVVPK